MFAQRARDNLACVAFCALVGGQDELVFDGHSCVIDHTGETIARAAQFREELLVCDVDLDAAAAARLRDAGHRPAARALAERASRVLPPAAVRRLAASADAGADARPPAGRCAEPLAPVEAEVYAALTLGLRDYVAEERLRARRARALRRDRLGARRVPRRRRARRRARERRRSCPRRYSSSATQEDARALAAALGVAASTSCRSSPSMDAYAETLGERVRRAASPT